jgi:hypothetical protein
MLLKNVINTAAKMSVYFSKPAGKMSYKFTREGSEYISQYAGV